MRGEVAPGDVIATLHTLLTMFVIECEVEVDGATVSEQDKRRLVASPARLSSPRTPMLFAKRGPCRERAARRTVS